MHDVPDLGRRAFAPEVVDRIRALLTDAWAGRALAEAHVLAVCGILAAGGTKAEVAEYLRHAEESEFGATRSAARDVNAIARQAYVLVRE